LVLLYCKDGSVRGYGIHISSSSKGSDLWIDDAITRHVIGLQIDKFVEDAPPSDFELLSSVDHLYSRFLY